MKLLSVQLARSVWQMSTPEINPRGKPIFADLVPWLVTTYKFRDYPKEGDEFREGMKFSNGVFRTTAGEDVQIAATIWVDGVGADTASTTNDTDDFLTSVLDGLPSIGYSYNASMVRRKGYVSQLFVSSEKELAAINPNVRDFASRLSKAVGTEYGAASIEFWPDQTKVFKPANFSFQKQIGEDRSSDRYWSQAALSTDRHLDLLNELEALLLV